MIKGTEGAFEMFEYAANGIIMTHCITSPKNLNNAINISYCKPYVSKVILTSPKTITKLAKISLDSKNVRFP